MTLALHSTPVANEFQMVMDELWAIPEVERVYVHSEKSSFFVTVIVPNSNPDVLEKVVTVESNVIRVFPWLNVDFDVVFRAGRELNEVVSPKGRQLFAR